MGGKLYPRPEDKDYLLGYALDQAQRQEDVQDSAIILKVAIDFTHPFNEANGRTGRKLYGWASRGFRYDGTEGAEPELLKLEGTRQLVDFGEILDSRLGHWLEDLVYQETGTKKAAWSVWHESQDAEAAKYHYAEREYRGLDETEREALDKLLGRKAGTDGKDPERYGANSEAILFGLSCIERDYGVELPKKTWSGDRASVITPDALTVLGGDQKRKLTEYMLSFTTLRAKAAIDLVSKFKDQIITDPGLGVPMSIKSYIVTITNNYLASKATGPALQRMTKEARQHSEFSDN